MVLQPTGEQVRRLRWTAGGGQRCWAERTATFPLLSLAFDRLTRCSLCCAGLRPQPNHRSAASPQPTSARNPHSRSAVWLAQRYTSQPTIVHSAAVITGATLDLLASLPLISLPLPPPSHLAAQTVSRSYAHRPPLLSAWGIHWAIPVARLPRSLCGVASTAAVKGGYASAPASAWLCAGSAAAVESGRCGPQLPPPSPSTSSLAAPRNR